MCDTSGIEELLDIDALNVDINNKSWQNVGSKLEAAAVALADEQKRTHVPKAVLDALMCVLRAGAMFLKYPFDHPVKEMTHCFRALRNSCVDQVKTQNELAGNADLLKDTAGILEFAYSSPNEDWALCLQIGIQFLGNLIVKNKETQFLVWNKFSSFLMKCLGHYNGKVNNYSAMVIYNIIVGHPEISLEIDTKSFETIIECAIGECEFACYCVDFLVRSQGFLQSVYKDLQNKHKLYILNTLLDVIGCKDAGNKDSAELPDICPTIVEFLAEVFKRQSFFILKTVDKYIDEIEPVEVATLLEIIASASGRSLYVEELQKDKSLLIDCTFLLKSIHSLGKEGDNHFSAIHQLSELDLKGKHTTLQEHPAFGFKAGLIRLMGNMCWKHKENQNQVLELEGIQLLLDCCKIDARNPLLMQWAIFAIRNLCEGNKETQRVIAGMTKQGEIDTSTLNQIGITLHADSEGSIGIMPLPH